MFTNTAPVDAYRGAGRPEATYLVERLVDTAAHELRMDPAELRRRNFIRQFPYATPVGLTYDIGDYEPLLNRAVALAEVPGFEARKAASRAKGLRRGLGYSCYIEACGIAPSNIAGALGARAGLFEAGEVRVHPTGKVTVFTGSHSHGQGHETTFAQVVADKLGIPIEDVDIQHGDTGKILFGMGTYGSRSIAVGGTAILKAADKIIAKGRKIAAHLLEAGEDDIEFRDGSFQVAGTDRRKSFAEIALTAYVPHNYPLEKLEPGLNENAFYDPSNFTYPAGAYICEVEVDPTTGELRIDRFVAVDDFGNVINPMIVEGQVHGGIAQGLGQALLEGCVYNSDGQLLTGTFTDYAMPRASDLPSFTVELAKGTPCTHNPLGVKGCGEAGRHRLATGPDQCDLRCLVGRRRSRRPDAGFTSYRLAHYSGRAPLRSTVMQELEYSRPASLTEAVKLVTSDPDARLLAGGQTTLPSMRLGLLAPRARRSRRHRRAALDPHGRKATRDRRHDAACRSGTIRRSA